MAPVLKKKQLWSSTTRHEADNDNIKANKIGLGVSLMSFKVNWRMVIEIPITVIIEI